jgi:serine/threonine protein kinase
MSHAGDKIADRYELQAMAGEGGMATVWRAVMRGAANFSRVVAIKEIKPEFGTIQSYVDMFVEEARVGSDLAHPNIVQVYDFLHWRDTYFLVMEWVEGVDLADFVGAYRRRAEPVPWHLVAAIGIHALRGLGAAHARRRPDGVEAPVIHRDVSPNNVLLSTTGQVKITDFGLARARDRVYSLTAPGTVKGKLSYLAPEVTYGKPATPQSDQFSIGSVLWEALTGRRLFSGPSDIDIFRQIRKCEVPSLSDARPDVPAPLAKVIHRALALDPGTRFETAVHMAIDLSAALQGDGQSPWELEDALAQEVTRMRSQRDRLPLPPAGLAGGWKPPARDQDPAETGPQRIFANRALAVEFVEFSDSDITTMPEYQPDVGDDNVPEADLSEETHRADSTQRIARTAAQSVPEPISEQISEQISGPISESVPEPLGDPMSDLTPAQLSRPGLEDEGD